MTAHFGKEVSFLRESVMGILLLEAAICDLKKRKIPNNLILIGWLLSLLLRFWQEGIEGVLKSVAAIIIILAAGFLLFFIRAVGAGDIKLWSVVSGMHGVLYFFNVLVVLLVLAGVWSFGKLVRKNMFAERFYYAWSYFSRKEMFAKPYYNRQRDGTGCTILLAPITAAAYFLVLLERWGGIR